MKASKIHFFILNLQGLVILKLDRLRICYGYDMAVDEFQPDEIAAGIKKVDFNVFYYFFVKKIRWWLLIYILRQNSIKRIHSWSKFFQASFLAHKLSLFPLLKKFVRYINRAYLFYTKIDIEWCSSIKVFQKKMLFYDLTV